MRLSKILTPERIIGARGDEKSISMYQWATDLIEDIGYGIKFRSQADKRIFMNNFDEASGSHIAFAWKYKKTPCPVYHIGRDFATAMSNVKKEIPFDHLPERFFAYFSFPEGTFTEYEEHTVRGGFISIGSPGETFVTKSSAGASKVLWINYELDPPDDKRGMPLYVGNLCSRLDSGIHKAIEGASTHPGLEGISNEVCRAFANLAIYIHSLDPDLLPTRPTTQTTNKQRKEFYKKHGVSNLCTLPVTFVSWNFKKPVAYSKESTTVSSHFRWQRCGPGFSQVKLILIEEHERHFKNKEIQCEQ